MTDAWRRRAPRALFILCCALALFGCENTDLMTATEAGMDAITAVTLSDEDVQKIALQATQFADQAHTLAPPDSAHGRRLLRLTSGQAAAMGGLRFNYAVYLSPEVNAFAMADGTIRVYSGLMDMLDDGELRFVIGHEMGHVEKRHIRKKIQLAYAARAVRKGIASQNNVAGDLARSLFGELGETLMNAQFSQLEEKDADDFGLAYLRRGAWEPQAAVSALRKIAQLDQGHSFLSSHPAPAQRAERLQAQLEGRAVPVEERTQGLISGIKTFLASLLPSFLAR